MPTLTLFHVKNGPFYNLNFSPIEIHFISTAFAFLDQTFRIFHLTAENNHSNFVPKLKATQFSECCYLQ